MGLTMAERETVITMDDAGDLAHVYTAQPRIIGQLRRNPAAVLAEEGSFEGSRWARFTIPARFISFRSVTRKYDLTDEQRAALGARLNRRTARSAPLPGRTWRRPGLRGQPG